jgi:urease accessory protein UreF
MAEYLAEQMRSLTRRLEELAQNPLPDTGLEGSLNAKQLAELLGVNDMPTFTRSMNKIRKGDTNKLTRAEMTELAEAFVRLLALEEKETQKVMMALKRVSAKVSPSDQAG